jgi:hypothetical protein
MTPATPLFSCRVMLSKGWFPFRRQLTRDVKMPAETAEQARERIAILFSELWSGWKITYLSEPRQIGGAQ